jgi:hypothetical protein
VSSAVTVGFGDESLAGVVRGDGGGGLICHDGRTSVLRTARVEARNGPGGPSWRAGDGGELDVIAEPLGEPAIFADGTQEWLCRVRGTAGGAELDGLGHAVVEAPAARSWKKVALARGVGAWLSEELAVTLRARRPARARNHEAEEVSGFVLRGAPPEAHPIDDPRLSTAYDAAGHQRRAGLELWETEESDYPLRLAGEAIGAGELDLDGGARLRCAFFVWRHAGRVGGGRYDLLLAGD